MPTAVAKRGGTRRPHFRFNRFANVKGLTPARDKNISHEPDSATAEIGRSEAKVLGDLPRGISPTAPRSYSFGTAGSCPARNSYGIVMLCVAALRSILATELSSKDQ